MARGWESKAVEAQQSEADRRSAREKSTDRRVAPTSEDVTRHARREALRLARNRAAADLCAATRPAHRQMLEQALTALDEQLRDLEKGPDAAST
jgi:hypothetical protein